MKPSSSRRGFLAAVVAGVCLLPVVSTAAIVSIGSGPDSSFLVLESPNLGTLTYEIRYTYDSGGAQDTYFLLNQLVASDNSYAIVYQNFGSQSSPNYFVNSINGEAGAGWVYWTHWVAGGTGFQNPDWSYNPGDVPDGSWSIGFGVSTHFIEPGSWDALYLSDGSTVPGVSPVPETSSAVFAVLGSLVIFKRRRRS